MPKVTYIDLEKIIPFEENPREKLEYRDLVPSIRERGLDKPLLVRQHPTMDGCVEIAQGHRRRGALGAIHDTAIESFKAHFPRGVPCIVMPKETTQQEFILAVADHGESRALTTDYELYMLAKLLFKAGCTRKDAIIKMASVLNTAKPFKKAELTARVNELTAKAEDESATVRDRAKAEVELEEIVVKARTGLMQRYYAIYELPEIVEAAYQFVCTGEKRDGYEDFKFPKRLTESQVKKLYSSKDGYLKDVDNGDAEKHPLFNERWEEYLKAAAKGKSEGARKSRSRKEVVETSGEMESGIAKTILDYAANESGVGVEKVRALDKDLQILEWLKTECSKEYKELEKRFEEWEKLRVEALSEEESE